MKKLHELVQQSKNNSKVAADMLREMLKRRDNEGCINADDVQQLEEIILGMMSVAYMQTKILLILRLMRLDDEI